MVIEKVNFPWAKENINELFVLRQDCQIYYGKLLTD